MMVIVCHSNQCDGTAAQAVVQASGQSQWNLLPVLTCRLTNHRVVLDRLALTGHLLRAVGP